MDNIGGYAEPKDPTDEIHQICAKMKPQVEAKRETNFKVFTPVKYRSQVVSGLNYFIKVDVGDCLHIYLMIYKNLSGGLSLTDVYPDPIKPEENVDIKPGGYSEPKDPTDEIHQICAEMKSEVEGRKNCKYEFFTLDKYRTQIVKGTNYHMKVDVGDCLHIYLMIYQNLSGHVELTDVQPDPILTV